MTGWQNHNIQLIYEITHIPHIYERLQCNVNLTNGKRE